MRDNVILIGFAATGKTCVGRRLAERLNREFYYAIADWTIHTDRLTMDQVADEVVHGLKYLED